MNRLKQFRKEHGLSQEELAEKSGVSRVTISKLESGELSVSKTTTLIQIADALGESVTAIFFADNV